MARMFAVIVINLGLRADSILCVGGWGRGGGGHVFDAILGYTVFEA